MILLTLMNQFTISNHHFLDEMKVFMEALPFPFFELLLKKQFIIFLLERQLHFLIARLISTKLHVIIVELYNLYFWKQVVH